MNRTHRSAAVILCLLTGLGSLGAAAPGADSAPHPAPHPAPLRAPEPALTATADRADVTQWQEFKISGSAHGIKPGTPLALEQKTTVTPDGQGTSAEDRTALTRWSALPASVKTRTNGTYAMRVKLGRTGVNELRITGGGAASPVVTVTVRPAPCAAAETAPETAPETGTDAAERPGSESTRCQ
ncbi:hypothetical protein ACFQVC_20195 [Streptomyces monticola]|uniref:Uncharacterized protein n=1 Tax=Streptomyces monticola TaxID=2666263 RepID=A0ABW2JMF9_9ACTN